MKIPLTYDCPKCGDAVQFPPEDTRGQCLGCKREWRLNPDAEFTDGLWKDLTTLTEIEPDLEGLHRADNN